MKKETKILVSEERKTHDLQSVSRTILPFAKNILGRKGFVEIDIIANWGEIVGEELADYTVPQQIEFKRGLKANGTLKVEVPSGAFALELQHREKIVLEKINAYFGYNAVGALRIIQNSSLKIDKNDKYNQDRKQKTIVSQEEENYIKDLSEDIKNSKLKEVLIKLGHSVITNNKDEKK